jgi:hypothetical protein
VLGTKYQVTVNATVRLRRKSDLTVLWEGTFSRSKPYSASLVTMSGINSVNPLYNLSAKRQNIEVMATEMMSETHDRITENF